VSNEKPAAHDLQAQSAVDKRAANERIEELDALVTFLHADVERHKDTLARQLHDNLSGSVIAAMMDVTWIQQHESPLTPSTKTACAMRSIWPEGWLRNCGRLCSTVLGCLRR
jgi:hypothetical protein